MLKLKLTKADQFYIEQHLTETEKVVAKAIGCSVKLVRDYQKALGESKKSIVTLEPLDMPEAQPTQKKANPLQLPINQKGSTIMTQAASEHADDEAKKYNSSLFDTKFKNNIFKCDE